MQMHKSGASGHWKDSIFRVPKRTISKGRDRIEISLSGKSTVEEFRELLGSTCYICLLVLPTFECIHIIVC